MKCLAALESLCLSKTRLHKSRGVRLVRWFCKQLVVYCFCMCFPGHTHLAIWAPFKRPYASRMWLWYTTWSLRRTPSTISSHPALGWRCAEPKKSFQLANSADVARATTRASPTISLTAKKYCNNLLFATKGDRPSHAKCFLALGHAQCLPCILSRWSAVPLEHKEDRTLGLEAHHHYRKFRRGRN